MTALIYRVLIAVPRAQVLNAQKYKVAESALMRNTMMQGKEGGAVRNIQEDLASIEAIYERYRPTSYMAAFVNAGLR